MSEETETKKTDISEKETISITLEKQFIEFAQKMVKKHRMGNIDTYLNVLIMKHEIDTISGRNFLDTSGMKHVKVIIK
jgi:hypothetical protein